MPRKKSTTNFLYLLAFIKLVIPFFLQNSFYQPHRDEFLYLAEGHHMAWGFMEIPPLLSVFAWLTNVFGASMFWIKIWPALFGACTFILVSKMVIRLGGKIFALILAWLPFMLSGYMRLFFLFQPNFLEVFFYVLIAYSLFRFFQTQKNSWLYVFGIAAGLGMMSKYSIAFYLISLMAAILLTPWRKIYTNKHFYFSSILALIIFLPNILWQYNHRFPVIAHMNELQEEQLQFIGYTDFLKSQVMMNLGSIFSMLAGIYFLLFSKKGKPFRALGFAYFFVIILLLIFHGKDYYAMGLYPMLFAFGGYQLESVTSYHYKWVRIALIAFPVSLGLYSLPLIMPLAKPEALATYYEWSHLNKAGDFTWEDHREHPLPQDFADMFGWKEIAEKTAKAYHQLSPAVQQETMIICNGYYTAGALNYYGKELNLPEAYSTNASFLLWMPDTIHAKNILLVDKTIPKDEPVFKLFGKISIKDSVSIPFFRETGTKIILLEDAHEQANEFIIKAIQKLKGEFKR